MVRIISFLGHFHREDIRNRLVILLSTLVKNMNILCGPSVLLLGVSTGGLLGSEGPRSQRESKTVGWNLPHKMFMFLRSVDKILPIDSLCLPDENGPKNDIIRTIIKDIT